MNSTPENQSGADFFHLLRDMKSPLTMNMVKNYIREEIQAVTFWQKVQHILFQNGMMVLVGGLIFFQPNPAGELHGGMKFEQAENRMPLQDEIPETVTQRIKGNKRTIISVQHIEETIMNTDIHDRNIKAEIVAMIEKTEPAAMENAQIMVTPSLAKNIQSIVSFSSATAGEQYGYPIALFAKIQGATMFDHANMYGGGFSLGFTHDWQIASVRFIDASGIHDDRKDPPTLISNVMRIKNETQRELDFSFGGVAGIGRFVAGIQIGPSLAMSWLTTGLKGTSTSNISTALTTLGVATDISAGYKFSDFLSADISGLLRYHTNVSGGILMSVTIRP